jgi:hypothetical protein
MNMVLFSGAGIAGVEVTSGRPECGPELARERVASSFFWIVVKRWVHVAGFGSPSFSL